MDEDHSYDQTTTLNGILGAVPRRSALQLPQELTDIIIDNISSDRDVLRQCSLVCKNWVPRSSRHLLRHVYWPPHSYETTPCQHTGEHSHECPALAGASFKACIDMLSSSFRLRTSIRGITLTSLRVPYFEESGDIIFEVLDMLAVTSILGYLPRLEILRIMNCALRSKYLLPASMKGYNLKELHIEDIEDLTSAAIIPTLLSLFHSVGRLCIGRVTKCATFRSRASLSALQIESLEFHHSTPQRLSDALCLALMSQTSCTSLRQLVCRHLTPDVATFIRAAPHLQSLSLHVFDCTFSPIPPGASPPSLTSLTLKRCIELYSRQLVFDTNLDSFWEPIVRGLMVLSIFEPREIVLSFKLTLSSFQRERFGTDMSQLPSFKDRLLRLNGWEPLAGALNLFKSLRTFVIEIDFNLCESNDFSFLAEHPGQCAAIVRDVATLRLPRRYVDILHVREV